jgi:ATP-dependent exoDNAse (exonuclease V) beta subunit
VCHAFSKRFNTNRRFHKSFNSAVDTDHSFFWRILKAHGYLVGLPRTMTILTPQGASIALADIRADYGRKLTNEQKDEKKNRETAERLRLATKDGRICFDLFAEYAADILTGSQRVCQLLATSYTLIILDEFQDTNAGQVTCRTGARKTHCVACPRRSGAAYLWLDRCRPGTTQPLHHGICTDTNRP